MKLQFIKRISTNNTSENIQSSIDLLEDLCDARGIKEEELDVIGEVVSNLYGALEVKAMVEKGETLKDSLNSFMKRVTLKNG